MDLYLPIYQAMAFSKHVTVASQHGDDLLNAFFCYSAPIWNFVNPSLFIREPTLMSWLTPGDMAFEGPFFSRALLFTIYAIATRYVDGLCMQERQSQSSFFEAQALRYLGEDLAGAPKLPTIGEQRPCRV